MAESQSRYGIMEELNTKKLAEKANLTKLEVEKAESERQKQDKIDQLKTTLDATEGTYKLTHAQWKAKREADIRIKNAELYSEIEKLQDEIASRDETYEPDFQSWKQQQEKSIQLLERDLKLYMTQQTKAIDAKKEILKEIDAGITNLKEMSKEQKEKA